MDETAPAVSEVPVSDGRTLADLKREHGFHIGSHLREPSGELAEQSPVRNYIRDLVLGFNDGLVSVFAVTAGVVGAAFGSQDVLVVGIAASVAGALSMAAGEFISTKSQVQFYESERKREEEHLRKWPHLEVQELRESLQAKGLKSPVLEGAVAAITADRERFLDYMMKEEFGVGEESQRSPTRAALFVIVAFLAGAAFAVLPYALLNPTRGLYGSAALSVTGLFLAGMARARASRLPMVRAGLEMVMIGLIAAGLTYGIGRLVGTV